MYGAILGDMIGSPYEFGGSMKSKSFPLFIRSSRFTDDTVMTVAVADALMDCRDQPEEAQLRTLTERMRYWGNKYPDAGYGGRFCLWLDSPDPRPYNSWGNGSAMRVSAAGWLFDTLEETRRMAARTALVTHNHPEGIKGAEAVAAAIWLARSGAGKEEIRDYTRRHFRYDLSHTCDEIRPDYSFDVSCAGTVPPAIIAFLEAESFEDNIRTAVSLGGDCDTLTCISAAIGEAYWGVPEELKAKCRRRLPQAMLKVIDRFTARVQAKE